MVQTRVVNNEDEQTPLLPCKPPPQAPTPLPKLQLAVLLLVQMCEPLSAQLIYPFIAQLVGDLDVTGGDDRRVGYYAGVIESLFFATEACTVLHWSRLSDHYGRKIIILTGLSGLGLSMLCFGLSRTFLLIIVSRCCAGILNGNIGVVKSMMGEITDSTNRESAFALIPAVWGAGATLGPLIGGTLARPAERFPRLFDNTFWRRYPYLLPCATATVLVMCTFALVLVSLKETVHRHQYIKKDTSPGQQHSPDPDEHFSSAEYQALEAHAAREEPVPFRALFVYPVIVSISNYFTLAFLDISVAALRPLFLALPIAAGGLGQTPSTIGLWLGAYGISTTLFQAFFFAPITRRWGTRRIFRVGMLAFFPIFALFPIIGLLAEHCGLSYAVWGLLALQLACSTVTDMAYGCIFIYVTTAAPNRRSLGATNGLSQMSVAAVRAVGPALVTSLFALSVELDVLHGRAVYALLAVLTAAAQSLAARLPEGPWPEGLEAVNYS